MKIDIDNLKCIIAKGGLVQNNWGNGKEKACIMGALAGLNEGECVAAGWPLWLVQVFEWFNDSADPKNLIEDVLRLGNAAVAFNARSGDHDRLFRDFRLQSVLPIAMESLPAGDEKWLVDCRASVQWSIDNDGAANPRAARVADAAWASGAADAAGLAWASWAAARQRMLDCLVTLMEWETRND